MNIKEVSFAENIPANCSIVVGVYADGALSSGSSKLDAKAIDLINSNINKIAFKGDWGKVASFVCCCDEYKYIILVGIGEKDKAVTACEIEKLGASIYSAASKLDFHIAILIDSTDLKNEMSAALLGSGAALKSWTFDKYKTVKKNDAKLQKITVVTLDAQSSTDSFNKLRNIADGVCLTRTVVSEPANVIYPESLADITVSELAPLGVKVQVLREDEMQKLGMNALLGVAQGSEKKPRLMILSWNGGEESEKPVAFVGKGVTFDSGGISIKPDNGMNEMIYDMAGAGTVLGLFKAIALNKLPVNVVGAMALVENMPSGTAQRPGDIVKSMSGQTIEILSTDAEGRLILADALWYIQDRFKPTAIVDLATLTGAIVVALGHEFAGLFSNSDQLADKIVNSSVRTGEKVWRMPLSKHFDDGINSDVADMRNIGKPNIRGGSITAAQFLQRFVNKIDWAHIDIAGVEASTSDDLFLCSNGSATGFGVRLLYDFLQQNYVK